MIDIEKLKAAALAVKDWELSDAWLDTSEDDPAAVVGHIDEDGRTYPVAIVDCDQYDQGGDSIKVAKFYAAANPYITIELIEQLEKAEKDAANYKAQLAESQAQNVTLRETLRVMHDGYFKTEEHETMCELALSTEPDATALNELIAKAGEVMRERCLFEIDPKNYTNDFAQGVVYGCCDEIRALPGVTMEDLK